MIVRLAEALLWFAVVVVLRLDRLWLRLRGLQLQVGGAIKVSARFFQPERHPPQLIYSVGGLVPLLGDVPSRVEIRSAGITG